METLDQIFVIGKSWVIHQLPEGLRPLAAVALSVIPLFMVFPLLFALTTVVERKMLGRIQNRYGPNRVGPFGFLQFAADGIKALTKEDVVPRAADKVVHFLAPIALVVPVLLTLAVVPVGRNMVALDLEIGLLFFFAVGASTELSVFMAGWSSRNKYSLLGAMRAISQMIAYELPLILAAVPVVMIAGTLSPMRIVEAQATHVGVLRDWFLFTPWGLAGFALFLVSAMAESNRSPFDLPEGESEIIAGYYLEYSGFKFALFFLGEYLGMFAISGMAITLFLGGWTAPVAALDWVPSWAWFFSKLVVIILFFIWVRGTLPRVRVDQLLNFAWKFLLPMALLNIVVAGIWFHMPAGWQRWAFGGGVLAMAYVLLGHVLYTQQGIGPRQYRFADR